MRTYFIGLAFNWQTGRYNLFVTPDRDQIPATIKALQSITATSKRAAKLQYNYGE
jgi:hypothetical protein